MKSIKLLIMIAAVMLTNGCSTTRITSTWKAADFTARKFDRIMVVGIIRESDRTLREKMETHLVDDLKSLGYNAVSAYAEYGPKAFQDMNEEKINKRMARSGVDAVLTIVLLDKQKEMYYVPGKITFTPYGLYQSNFWLYYQSINNRIQSQGYYQESTKYFWESNFYDLAAQKLVYSVQTQSFDPASTEMLAHENGKKIVLSMIKSKVITNQDQKPVKTM